MIIDFHTHTFPDKIAAQAIKNLETNGNVKAFLGGTLGELKDSMKRAGVDRSVILPVATAPKQTASINRLAAELNGKDGILYSGAIHPDSEDVDEILDFVKSAGLFGIKLHPDYQGVYFDDERNIRIMEKAAKRGLYIVTHAGLDVAYPNDVHCTPDMVLRVLDRLKGVIEDKLILAHLGGYDEAAEVLNKLVGKPVYMDTAVVLDKDADLRREIIRAHGVDKILFATDSPWADQSVYVKLLREYGFSEEELQKMYSGNALKILASAGIYL